MKAVIFKLDRTPITKSSEGYEFTGEVLHYPQIGYPVRMVIEDHPGGGICTSIIQDIEYTECGNMKLTTCNSKYLLRVIDEKQSYGLFGIGEER